MSNPPSSNNPENNPANNEKPSQAPHDDDWVPDEDLTHLLHDPPSQSEPPSSRKLFRTIMLVLFFATGLLAGLLLAPESPKEALTKITRLQSQLDTCLKVEKDTAHSTSYKEQSTSALSGKLSLKDRESINREGRRYAALLRKEKAQPAADLMLWFVERWTQLIDKPEPEDRIQRRAAALSLLVGGMGSNLNPGDYIPWQAEFFNGRWLPELHYDADGDGLPGTRSRPNNKDGFANMSVCHIAMAINQAVNDAQILVMPNMHCDRPGARMSVFLQGATWDDAITEFMHAVQEHGMIANESTSHGVRLILIGNRP